MRKYSFSSSCWGCIL